LLGSFSLMIFSSYNAIFKGACSDNGKGSYKRYKKDSFDYYKQVIESNGTNLNYSE